MGITMIDIEDIDFYREGIALLNSIARNGNFMLIFLAPNTDAESEDLYYTTKDLYDCDDLVYIKMERDHGETTALLITDIDINTIKGYTNAIKDFVGKIRISKPNKENSMYIRNMIRDVQGNNEVRFVKNKTCVVFEKNHIRNIEFNTSSDFFKGCLDRNEYICIDIYRLLIPSNNNTKEILYNRGIRIMMQ